MLKSGYWLVHIIIKGFRLYSNKFNDKFLKFFNHFGKYEREEN